MGRSHADHSRKHPVNGMLGRLVQHPLHRAVASLCTPHPDAGSVGTGRATKVRRGGAYQSFTRAAGIGAWLIVAPGRMVLSGKFAHSPSPLQGRFFFSANLPPKNKKPSRLPARSIHTRSNPLEWAGRRKENMEQDKFFKRFEPSTPRSLRSDGCRAVSGREPAGRTLKIEASGDFWKGLIKPKIRLTGHWLERAGFRPGNRVHITYVAPGVIELRSLNAVVENRASQPKLEKPDCPF